MIRLQPHALLVLAAILTAGAGPQTQPAPETPPATQPGRVVGPNRGEDRSLLGGGRLREGSYLLQVKGTLRRQVRSESWTFHPLGDVAPELPGELTLLPCTLLANLEQLVVSMPADDLVFELSGEVFVYRDRNYLLPTHAPRLAGYVPAPPVDTGPAPAPDDAESAQDILRDLERAVGPVPRSAGAARTPPDATGAKRTEPLAPGTLILWRRGWMVREGGGAWSFIFEADASGLADPPMVLLPCLLLQAMERRAEQAGVRAPMLVSGRVFRYHGRNYLQPTSFQVARLKTPLRP